MGIKVRRKIFLLNAQAKRYIFATSLTALGIIIVFSLLFHVSPVKFFAVVALNAILYLTVLTGNRKNYFSVILLNALFALTYFLLGIRPASIFIYLLLCQICSTYLAYACFRLMEDNNLAKLKYVN